MNENQHSHSKDDLLWWGNRNKIAERLEKKLRGEGYVVIPVNTANPLIGEWWDSSIHDTSVVMTLFDDTTWDDLYLDELEATAKEHNIKFTLVTDIFYKGRNNYNSIKILFVKEFYGMYYNPHILPYTNPHGRTSRNKLHNCLIQRATLQRLHMFAELVRNNLIDKGNTSFLGYQPGTQTPNDVMNDLNETYNNDFDDIVNNYDFPFRNFVDPDDLSDLEIVSRYSISLETYNTDTNLNWVSFTEKTVRSLQIPNISLIANKGNSSEILEELGFKVHPINYVLDRMPDYYSQTEFIIGILKQDMFPMTNEPYRARHNQELLKVWHNLTLTDEFYDNIAKEII
jgi:hypothetical protein